MSRSRRSVNVIPQSGGGWAVRSSDAPSGRVFSTQAEAVSAARAAVRERGGEVRIHGSNGRVKSQFTLGRSAMTRINEVEGVTLSPSAKAAFKSFDRQGLSPTERRLQLRTQTKSRVKS